MSIRRTALAVPGSQPCLYRLLPAILILLLAGSLFSCGGKKIPAFGSGQTAYVTLPSMGSVLQLRIDSLTGAMTPGALTPQVAGTSPFGLALLSNTYLYVGNSTANTISIFSIASDGNLSQNATPVPSGGSGPHAVVIDPSGKFLLVTNSFSNNIAVFSINTSTGALSQVSGSPFYANDDPGEILMPASGDLVYITNTGVGTVTAFTFSTSTGALTPVPGSPYYSGPGASGLAVESIGSGTYLYVANSSAVNPGSTSVGNISAFSVNTTAGASYGALSPLTGSPFTSVAGSAPAALVIDPNNKFLFATTPGGSYSVWCYLINTANGQLTAALNSPFSVAAGGLFALIDPNGSFFYIGSPSGIQGYTYNQNDGQPSVINNSPFSTDATVPGKMVIVP